MTKPIVHIENWESLDFGTRGRILTGNVVDHPRFSSGAFIYTSTVLHSNGNEVETRNTIYILGKKRENAAETIEAKEAN